jgi:hypothetical protein
MSALAALALFAVWPLENYHDARYVAIGSGQPLVVGVRCDPPRGPWLTVRVDEWPWGRQQSFVVVSTPMAGELYHRSDLPAAASTDDVTRLISPPPAGPRFPGGPSCVGPICPIRR